MNSIWYRRKFQVSDVWKKNRTLLHFDAVDYYCEVWINGQNVGCHKGGYTNFSFDITKYLTDDDNVLVVYAEDDTRSGQPRGKQSSEYHSAVACYTRVTGIWQTVWLENVPETYIKSYKVVPDIDNSQIEVSVFFDGTLTDKILTAEAKYGGKSMGKCSV